MSLYHKHRPSKLEEIIGNESVVNAISKMITKKEVPHALLFTGDTGCGKTTMARIIAAELGSKGSDLKEVDSADFRGIDTVREIRKQARFLPIESNCKVWIIDECFPAGTKVTMANGLQKEIQNIRQGEVVKNLMGTGKVNRIFKNKVPFHRLVKIHFEDGQSLICSESHEFMTEQGWVEAKNLKNNFVFSNIISNFALNINTLIICKNEKRNSTMPGMFDNTKKATKKVLLNKMLKQCKRAYEQSKSGNQIMPDLSKRIQYQMVLSKQNMFHQMWQYLCRESKKRTKTHKRTENETFKKSNIIFEFTRWIGNKADAFKKNENQQSIIQQKEYREGKTNKKNEGDIAYMERRTRRKRKTHKISNIISNFFGLENGSCSSDRSQSKRQFRISHLLQNRCGKRKSKNWNRSGWQGTSEERIAIVRQKENKQVKSIRVDDIEIYKRGCNEQSFESVIGNTEKNQGFVTFYDLEIDNHHSYYANNILVHNCHKMTNDAQNALLKILEDTPKHVYFILCTTDPQKLLKTIKGRCSSYQMELLSDKQMLKLLRRVVIAEDEKIEREVYEQLVQDAQGHPRNALQVLEQVLNVEPDLRLDAAKRKAEEYSEAIQLCRALIEGKSWKVIAGILKGLKSQDPEGIRRIVLGYAQAVLLNSGNPQAAVVLECFMEPFYNSGFPQVTHACYLVVMEEDEE